MTNLAAPTMRIVLYEGAGSAGLPDPLRAELMLTLLQRGYSVSCVRNGGTLASLERGSVLVMGRFADKTPPQAMDTSGQISVHFRDIDGMDSAAALALVDAVREEAKIGKPGGWKPWFPVIDYGRCTNCMQCLSFCLFDVYGVSDKNQIQVQHQNNCKTDCPACSRVCPEVAILFPKYKSGPINGDEIDPEDLRREAMKVDISALLGGDIYQALRDRSAKAKSRFSKERDEDKALKERMRCLQKLSEGMEIPAEVLAALPSADQIASKAAAAKAKAEAALAGRNAD